MIGEIVVKKKCKTCGKDFETVWPRQAYCSDQCRQGKGKCIVCGREFLRKPRTTGSFCSPRCWYEYYRRFGKKTNTCPICGTEFHGGAKTCGKECGYALRRQANPNRRTTCEYCGKPLQKNVKPKVRFCSRSCALAARNKHGGHSLPDGAKYKDNTGYIRIKVDGQWLLEHRYIMEQKLGRPLEPHERVHHRNGNRSHNTHENLELWTVKRKDPAGQRASDLIEQVLKHPKLQKLPKGVKNDIRLAIKHAFRL